MNFLRIWKKKKITENLPDNSVVINLEKEISALKAEKQALEKKLIESERVVKHLSMGVSQYKSVFPVLQNLNSIAESKTEKSVINATDAIFSISEKSSDLGVKITDILSNTFLGDNGLSQSTASLLEINSNISTLNKDFGELCADFGNRLIGFDEQLKKIEVYLSNMVNLSEETNILAINTAIEAARMGNKAGGFTVISKSIRNLSEKSRNIEKTTVEMVKNVNTLLNTSFENFKLKSLGFGEVLNEIHLKVDTISNQIKNETIQAEKTIKETEELPVLIQDKLHDIINKFQFQDITRQIQEHIIQIVEEMNKMNNEMLIKKGIKSTVCKEEISPEVLEMIKQKFTVSEEWATIGNKMSCSEENNNITLF